MAFLDLGNCKSFKIKHDVQKKEHFTTHAAQRTKDRTDVTQVAGSGDFVLDEINGPNLALLAMATVIENTDGSVTLYGLSKTTFTGTLRVTQLNSRGPTLVWEGSVSMIAGGEFNMIQDSDDYNEIPVSFDIQPDDDGHYGTWTLNGAAASPDIENYQIPTGKVEFEADA